jgi:hypothetical protein
VRCFDEFEPTSPEIIVRPPSVKLPNGVVKLLDQCLTGWRGSMHVEGLRHELGQRPGRRFRLRSPVPIGASA